MALLFAALLNCSPPAEARQLHGFVLAGDPAASGGATWTYNDTIGGVIYDLSGILFKPAGGAAPYPAVVISHGHGGNVGEYTTLIAKTMCPWGLVCIGTNYTHAGGVPVGSPGDSTAPGASGANILRARKCLEILASLGYVDTSRIAAHGNSMGAFVTAAVVGRYPTSFLVASHSAGGVNNTRLAWTKIGQAQGITAPYQIHHGDADTTVPIADDERLDSILQARGVVHEMFVYPGYSHTDITVDTTMLGRVHEWYSSHGLFTATGITEGEDARPAAFALEPNYPNPFNPVTTLRFDLPARERVTITLFDLLGREYETLLDGVEEPGPVALRFDASGLASGSYFYRVTAGNASKIGKLVVMR